MTTTSPFGTPPGGWPEYTGDNLPPWMTEHLNSPEPEDESAVEDHPVSMRVDLLVINLDGRAHLHVMFDGDRPTGQNTRNIHLDGDEFDPLITPSVEADIGRRLRSAAPDIAGLLQRLERRSNEGT